MMAALNYPINYNKEERFSRSMDCIHGTVRRIRDQYMNDPLDTHFLLSVILRMPQSEPDSRWTAMDV
jgi:hypothetical protein